jgi:hypothetical protein
MAIEFDKRSYLEWLALGVDPPVNGAGSLRRGLLIVMNVNF